MNILEQESNYYTRIHIIKVLSGYKKFTTVYAENPSRMKEFLEIKGFHVFQTRPNELHITSDKKYEEEFNYIMENYSTKEPEYHILLGDLYDIPEKDIEYFINNDFGGVNGFQIISDIKNTIQEDNIDNLNKMYVMSNRVINPSFNSVVQSIKNSYRLKAKVIKKTNQKKLLEDYINNINYLNERYEKKNLFTEEESKRIIKKANEIEVSDFL